MDPISGITGRTHPRDRQKTNDLIVETPSNLINIKFRSSQSYQFLWPDVTVFFNMLGWKIYAGIVDSNLLQEKSKTLWPLKVAGDIVLGTSELTPAIPYHSKKLYFEDPTGKSFHTPVIATHINGVFYIDKGYKKLTACSLADVTDVPCFVITQSGITIDGLTEIFSDQEFYDYLRSISDAVDTPSVGIEFRRHVGQILVPVIHWLDINEDASQRPDWSACKKADIELWKDRPRLVLVTKPPVGNHSKPNEHFKYQWTNQTYIDVATARACMDDTMCATIFASDGEITRQLTDALVWLSTDADCNVVGAVVAQDCAIVYNNSSDLIINMPPGLIEKKDK
jgi:hypothetical protein